MRLLSIFLVFLLLTPIGSLGACVPLFEDDRNEAIASLTAPNYEATVNLVLPADYYVKNATFQVTGMAAEGNPLAYPELVNVTLDNKVLWAFNKTGYGPLGMQNQFSTGQKEIKFSYGSNGGSQSTYIRLPKGAIVQNAEMVLTGIPPSNTYELARFTGALKNGDFGCSVSNAGDMNGDGNEDIIIGAHEINSPGTGHAYLYFGNQNTGDNADVTFTGEASGDSFGFSVSDAGDVNGDGFDDAIVGASGANARNGKAFIFFGGQNMDNVSDITFTGSSGEGLGGSVSGAGDVNGDGYDDVIIGAYTASRAYIFFGNSSMNNIADVILTGEAAGDRYGIVSQAGDVNKDGFDDVIVGAFWNDAGGTDAGRAYLYYGGKSMNNVADIIFTGVGANDYFGFSSDACDVNGDGYNDIIIGAPQI